MQRKKNEPQKYSKLSTPELLRRMYPSPTVDMPGPSSAPPNIDQQTEDGNEPVFGLALIACLIFLNSVVNFGEAFIFEKYINFTYVSTVSIFISILSALLAVGLLLRYESARILCVMLNTMVLVVIIAMMVILRGNHVINLSDFDFTTITALAVPLVSAFCLTRPSVKRQFN